MAQPQGKAVRCEARCESKSIGKLTTVPAVNTVPPQTSTAPCGACKFLRRKCVGGCIFAPHFGSDQGAARFAAVHKIFGASNVSKLLSRIPANRRHDAVVTISYEAQARLSDPVYGCVSTILAFKQQVTSLQAELAIAQAQLMNNRLAVANALHSSQHQHQQQPMALIQPAYSNNSSASNNFINMSGFAGGFELRGDTVPSSHSLEPIKFCQLVQDEDEEEEIQNPIILGDQILH